MVMLWNIDQRNYQNFFYYMGMIRLQKTSTPKTFAGNILVRIFFGWDKSCQSCDLKKMIFKIIILLVCGFVACSQDLIFTVIGQTKIIP